MTIKILITLSFTLIGTMNLLKKILFHYFARCARLFLRKKQITIIGIHGSVGKTSCRMIVTQILRALLPKKIIHTSEKNFNGELGMSLSILGLDDYIPSPIGVIQTAIKALRRSLFTKPAADIMVLEYGIDHPGEMDFLLSIVKPDIGISTKLDAVHSEQFGSPDEIAREELKMALATKKMVFLDVQDREHVAIRPKILVDCLTYTTAEYEKADLSFSDSSFSYKDSIIFVNSTGNVNGKEYKLSVSSITKYSIGYSLIGMAIADVLAYQETKKTILDPKKEYEFNLRFQAGRSSVFSGIHESVIVDSTYNASPESVATMVQTVYRLREDLFQGAKFLLILGDMRELGERTERYHRQVAGKIFAAADQIVLIGPAMGQRTRDELQKVGFAGTIDHFTSSREAGLFCKQLIEGSTDKYVVLGKGSQNTIFVEESLKALLKNSDDIKQLPRQSSFWLAKKQKFYDGLTDR